MGPQRGEREETLNAGDVFLLLVCLSLGRKFYSKKCAFPSFGLPFLSRSSQDPFCILVILNHSSIS